MSPANVCGAAALARAEAPASAWRKRDAGVPRGPWGLSHDLESARMAERRGYPVAHEYIGGVRFSRSVRDHKQCATWGDAGRNPAHFAAAVVLIEHGHDSGIPKDSYGQQERHTVLAHIGKRLRFSHSQVEFVVV